MRTVPRNGFGPLIPTNKILNGESSSVKQKWLQYSIAIENESREIYTQYYEKINLKTKIIKFKMEDETMENQAYVITNDGIRMTYEEYIEMKKSEQI